MEKDIKRKGKREGFTKRKKMEKRKRKWWKMENELKKTKKKKNGERDFINFSWTEHGEVKFGKRKKKRTWIFYHKFGNGKRHGGQGLNMEKRKKEFLKKLELGEEKNMVEKIEKKNQDVKW
jgi:hypothetical protein